MEFDLRVMDLKEFKSVFKRMKRDFPRGEYAPYMVLKKQIKTGVQKSLILTENGEDVAYAIFADSHENGYVLLSYMSVYEEYRGKGIGTVFLKKIKDYYSDKRGIVVEVEIPEEAKDSEEQIIRRKRIAFYEKSGFKTIPNVEYCIFGIPMHLMVLPLKESIEYMNAEIGRIIYELYLRMLGKVFIHQLHLRR